MTRQEQRDPESTISRRTLVHGLAVSAGATVAGASGALAQASPKPARWRRRRRSPTRRAISARAAPRPPISGTPTSSRSIRPSTTSPSPTRRSSASGPACCGPKGRPGARRAAISCGATFPTTGRCDGRRTTATSACSARRPTTPTATRSTSRAASSPASISPAAWCATSTTAPRPCSPTISTARSSTRPTTSSPIPDGSYWFTDPPYGGQLYEGEPDVAGGPSNAGGKLNPRIGQPAGFVPGKRELPTNCYRIDPVRPHRPRGDRGAGARSQRPLLLARLQEAVRRQHRQGTGRHRAGRQGRHLRVRRRRRQQALQPASCSATSWSTA